MEFEISRTALLTPLRLLTGIIERKQTLPILGNILLQLEEGGQLHLCTTDSELEMTCQVQVDSGSPGKTTLPALKLFDICRSLSDGASIQIKQEDNRVSLKSGRSRFSLTFLPAEDFPSSEELKPQLEFSLPQGVFKNLLSRTHFSMAQQDVRYYLNGVLLDVDTKGISVVATDGHRLALAREELVGLTEQPLQVIIPRKTVLELVRNLEDNEENIKIAIGSGHIRFALPHFVFSSQLIDGNFPDYQGVIPARPDLVLTADSALLKQSLSRVAILSSEKYKGVRLSVSANQLHINAHNPEQEEAEEELDVEYEGEEMEIGFNFTYLLDALNAINSDQSQLCFSDANSSCLMRAKDDTKAKYVIMPMRL